MDASSRPRGWWWVPPPILFAAPLVVGLVMNRRWPLVSPSNGAGRWVAIALIVVGAAHTLTSVFLFAVNRTTVIPHGQASRFVQRGAYRWTRNPMYVGLTLIYLGICALTAAVWPLLFLPLPLIVLDAKIIPMEERHMEAAFGQDYVAYKARVRRWL